MISNRKVFNPLLFLLTFLFLAPGPVFAEPSPRQAQKHYEQGVIFMQKGNVEEAVLELEQAAEFMPDSAQLLNTLGLAYMQRPQTAAAAVETFNKVIEIDPTYADAYSNLGMLYSGGLRDYDTAIQMYEKGLEYRPDDARSLFGLGWLYLIQKNDPRKAIPALERVVELNPRNAQALFHLGLAYFQNGDTHMVISPISKLKFQGHKEMAQQLEALMTGQVRSQAAEEQLQLAQTAAEASY